MRLEPITAWNAAWHFARANGRGFIFADASVPAAFTAAAPRLSLRPHHHSTLGAAALLAASPDMVAAYVDHLASIAGRKAAGIRQAVWAIGAMHRLSQSSDPTKAEPVRLALKRMSRELGTRQSQAWLAPEVVERMSGHSLRVGMAQDLVASGADVEGVMQAGRWKSPLLPARYSARLQAKRGAVARLYERADGV